MESAPFQNVLFIVVDTLRARNVGLYGSGHDTTPVIDSMGANGVTFERAICTHSGSWISYTSMFRGDHVFSFPLSDAAEFDRLINERTYKMAYNSTPIEQTAIGRLSDAGVHTTAIVSGSMLNKKWGWNRGFDRYDDSYETALQSHLLRTKPSALLYRAARKLDQNRFPPFGMRPADTTKELACAELERLSHQERPWFFFLQFTDPHTPNVQYERAPPGWHLYDQDIRRTDDAIGSVLEKLDDLDLCESTLIILTADHGESLGEHGASRGHGQNVFEESIRVPLVLFHRSLEPTRISQVDGVARLKDIGPTILDAFEVTQPDTFTGESLLPVANGENEAPTEAITFARGHISINATKDTNVTKAEAGPVVALHTGTHKFITTPALDGEFEWGYDLRKDPREQQNLVGTRHGSESLRERLRGRINEWERRSTRVPAGTGWTANFSMTQQLKDLGYIE